MQPLPRGSFLLIVLVLGARAVPLQNDEASKVCQTAGCKKTADNILQLMDSSVNPCDDFYQFACGGYIKNTPIPDDSSTVGKFAEIADVVKERLRAIMESPVEANEERPYKLLKKYYKQCMDVGTIEKEQYTTLKAILNNVGGWPALEGKNWNANSFNWIQTIYKLKKQGLGGDYFLKVMVGPHAHNASLNIIGIDEPSIILDKPNLLQGLQSKLTKAYYDLIVDLAVLMGADRQTAADDLKATLDFHVELKKITLPEEDRRNFTLLTNIMKISKLAELVPQVPWIEYLTNIIGVPGIVMHPNDEIDISVPKYFEKLIPLLERTPKRVQANYIMTGTVLGLSSLLNQAFRDRLFEFNKVAMGVASTTARWKECVESTVDRFDIATGALYIRKYFGINAKKRAEELVSNLRKSFIGMLKKVNWMDEETRQKAIEKAEAINMHIGYPKELLDDDNIKEYYLKLKESDSYLQFTLNIINFSVYNKNKVLKEPINKQDWRTHAAVTTVNAGYAPAENSIVLQSGILQGVFFENDRPEYMNYGGIGFVIGHEITHGFDDQGKQGDKDGQLVDWWSEKTSQAYVERAQCIIDQFGNVTVPAINQNLNGVITQGENIADNGGIKEAYLAYQAWVKSHWEEPTLPGIKYTPTQLFWISAAHVWCSKERPQYLYQVVASDPHSPNYYRVVETFKNSHDFAKDFNCPAGSPMNPVHKCDFW